MNMWPGGKQAHLRDGWFIKDGHRHTQPMNFPASHPEFLNMLKGIRQVLVEIGLFVEGTRMQCKEKCSVDATRCCAKRILENQPDFKEQRSLVQEVIESAGHLCIFLPKFHCELNFIEYFRGTVKRYLDTLKANLPKALESVPLETIRCWEHRTCRWMEAYQSGMSAKEVQTHVQLYSSKKYKSHRHIPEWVAAAMD
jgi:hypothetical protein